MTPRSLDLARVGGADGDDAATTVDPRQRLIAVGLLAAVVLLDQAAKWWAWRHVHGAIINAGSTWPIGHPVSDWFSGRVSGRILDVLDVGLLSLAGHILVRRRRRGPVLVSGALMTAGWSSNLLDRLGVHAFTAPGSVRGAIDFIHLGPPYVNLADFVILGATVVFPLAVWAPAGRRVCGATAGRFLTARTLHAVAVPWRAWPAAVGVAVALVLAASTVIGVESPPRAALDAGASGRAARGSGASDARSHAAIPQARSLVIRTLSW